MNKFYDLKIKSMRKYVQERLSLATTIIKEHADESHTMGSAYKFQRPYEFTNESPKRLDFEGKSVLTVGSSCDQTLYSLLFGAKSVTLFDLNPFVEFIFDLKSAAIQNLSMMEMRKLFPLKIQDAKLDFNEMILRLQPSLSKSGFNFWFGLGERFSHREIIAGFFDRYGSMYPKYLQSQNDYSELRQILEKGADVRFIHSSLHDLPQNLNKYERFDIALLSNVLDYYNPKYYKEDVKAILPFMNNGALIQMNYVYNHPSMPNATLHPNKQKDIENLFRVEAINFKPNGIRDYFPRPTSRDGSYRIASLSESSLFVRADDLKRNFEEEEMNNVFEQGALNRYFANNPEGSVNLSQEEIEQMFAEADSHKETVASNNTNYQHNSPEYVDGQGCVEVSSPELNGYEFPKISDYPFEDGQEL